LADFHFVRFQRYRQPRDNVAGRCRICKYIEVKIADNGANIRPRLREQTGFRDEYFSDGKARLIIDGERWDPVFDPAARDIWVLTIDESLPPEGRSDDRYRYFHLPIALEQLQTETRAGFIEMLTHQSGKPLARTMASGDFFELVMGRLRAMEESGARANLSLFPKVPLDQGFAELTRLLGLYERLGKLTVLRAADHLEVRPASWFRPNGKVRTSGSGSA
jgi:hypothetical protein